MKIGGTSNTVHKPDDHQADPSNDLLEDSSVSATTHSLPWLPLPKFFCDVIEYFHVHLSILNPFGCAKLTTFVVMCKAYGEIAFRNFMYAKDDEDLSFLPQEPSLGLPDVPKLQDVIACHLKISNINPSTWKGHLDNQELLKVVDQIKGECEVLEERENARDKECEDLKAKCEAAMADFDNNPAINVLHQKIMSLPGERYDPFIATELVHSDEMGLLVGKLVSSVVFYRRCDAFEEVAEMKDPFDLSKVKGYRPSYKKEHTKAGNDLATATFPFLPEVVADPSALPPSFVVGIKRLLDDLEVIAAKCIQMVDYSLWEVIENSNAPPITKVVKGVETVIAPTTAKEKAQRRLELKAVEKRFGGNVATKKTQRNLLKQQYENFTTSSLEVLDQTFDRLQKLISQLKIHSESISQEDVNHKFLRSLSPEWNTHTIVWRNKPDIDTLSLDDLYNNLKIYEPEVKGTSSSYTNTQNVAFVSLNSTSSTNGAVNTAHDATTASTQVTAVNSTIIDNLSNAVICAFFASQPNSPQLDNETMQTNFILTTGREFSVDWALRNQENKNRETTRRVVPVDITTSNALVSCDGSGYDWSDQAEEGPTNFALMAYTSTISNSEDLRTSKLNDIAYKTGYDDIPPPTGNFMPPKPDLSFSGLEEFVDEPIVSEPKVKKPIVETSEPKVSADKPKFVKKNNGPPLIEDWISDSEDEAESKPKNEKKTVEPSFAKIEFGNPHQELKENDVINSGCSRHMTRNMSYLTNFEEIDRGYVAFGGSPKGGKITGIGTIKTGNLDFENVYFFSENTPNIARSGPNWLFDIDALTKSMNYKLVVAENQSNGNAGTKTSDDAGKARMEKVPGKDYILLPLWPADPLLSQIPKNSPDDEFKPSGDDEKKITEEPGKEGGDSSKDSECSDQEKEDNVNSTNNVNTASNGNNTNNINAFSSTVNAAGIEVNAVGAKTSIELPDDPNMPELEEIVYSDDVENIGAETDMNNLNTFIHVSPIPTTRIHKDHPVEQIIRDLNSAPQTRRMTKNLKEHGLFSSVQQRTNHKDFQNCLFACFLSQEEPKKVIHALKDPSWIEAMQDELLQFKLQKVWTKMDSRAAFLWYNKVEKSHFGLHQAPRAWYETLSTYLLDNGFQRGKIDRLVYHIRRGQRCQDNKHTAMETQKPLLNDEDGEEVDVHFIGSILVSLIYLKGQPKLGLWYPKDSPFDLVAYTDSDYARASLDRKSTTGEAEYVAASSCCGQHIEIRQHFIRDSNEKKLIQMIKILTDKNVADLLTKAFDFWSTLKAKMFNEEVQLQALLDGKKIVVTEATVRRDLQLEDADGVDCLPNATIFEQLTLIGYEKLSQKLTFYKAFFSPQWKFLIHTILQCLSAKTTAWNEFSSTMASTIICLATNQKFNFSKYIFESMVKNLDSAVKFLMYPRFVQVFLNNQLEGTATHNRIYIAPSHTKKVFANMKRQGKDFSGRVTPLFPTMVVQA
ncbi:hypothetical protein Tco_1211542 [Tanacetum coccineum]